MLWEYRRSFLKKNNSFYEASKILVEEKEIINQNTNTRKYNKYI